MSWSLTQFGRKKFEDSDIYHTLQHSWFPENTPILVENWFPGCGDGYIYRDFSGEWMGIWWSEDGMPRFGDPMVASF